MATLQALTRTRLIALVEETIQSYGEQKFTISQLAQKALASAREICLNDFDAAVVGWIKPIARRLLRKVPSPAGAPMLLPGMVLPYRIAVPAMHGHDPSEDDEDDEDSGILWIPLHLCSIAEGRRNLELRASLIERSQTEYDRIKLVVDEAASRTTDQNAIIGDVLSS